MNKIGLCYFSLNSNTYEHMYKNMNIVHVQVYVCGYACMYGKSYIKVVVAIVMHVYMYALHTWRFATP